MHNQLTFKRTSNRDNDEQIAQLRKSARLTLFPEMNRKDSQTSSSNSLTAKGFEDTIHGKSISRALSLFA